MTLKEGGFLKVIVIIVAIIVISAGYYFLRPEDPVIEAEEGDIQIHLSMDETTYINESFYAYANITITNVAIHYIHIWFDPANCYFILINNTTKYSNAPGEIFSYRVLHKLNPGKSYSLSYDNEYLCNHPFRSYSSGSIQLPRPDNYQLYYFMRDFNTTSNKVSFEIY